MIIFLPDHPQQNQVMQSVDCMTNENFFRTVEALGSKRIYSDVFKKSELRYWVTMIDNDTGEKITCEYELFDNTDTIMVS